MHNELSTRENHIYHAWNWRDLLKSFAHDILHDWYVLVKQDCQVSLLSRVLP